MENKGEEGADKRGREWKRQDNGEQGRRRGDKGGEEGRRWANGGKAARRLGGAAVGGEGGAGGQGGCLLCPVFFLGFYPARWRAARLLLRLRSRARSPRAVSAGNILAESQHLGGLALCSVSPGKVVAKNRSFVVNPLCSKPKNRPNIVAKRHRLRGQNEEFCDFGGFSPP